VRTLGPILDRAEFFRFFAESRAADGAQRFSEAQLHVAFVATGGIHGRMDHAQGLTRLGRSLPQEDALLMVTDLTSKYRPLLKAMLGRLQERHEAAARLGSVVQQPWQLVEWIPWSELRAGAAELRADVEDMPRARRYAAADDGAVVYEEAEAGERVRFVSPLQAIVLHERSEAPR